MLKKSALAVVLLLTISGALLAQTIKSLAHRPPDGMGIGFLLTDGTVMFQGDNLSDWYKLTPDISGSYLNGTWSRLANSPYAPYAFSSAVLADGRVVVIGGEYTTTNFDFTLTNLSAIYDPQTNTWADLGHPNGWLYIGDSPSVVLPNGKFLIGDKLNKSMAVLDPATMQWTAVGSAGKTDFNSEEGWTLMPDGSVLTYDVKNAPNSEKYLPLARKWVTAGSTIVDLHSPPSTCCIQYGPGLIYHPPGEVGPGILRPDGTVFATGSSASGPGHTAIYHPGPTPTDPGTWTVGPNFPGSDNAGDSYAALLPNGNVLVLGVSGQLYEFDGSSMIPGPVTFGSLMMLPTGEVIIGNDTGQLYTPTGTYQPEWAPRITNYPHSVIRGTTYQITGKQFNGLSQAAAFGDEFETATNYPLVRITNTATGHVFYARTHGHSSMGVATGNAPVSTNFDVPSGMETGASTLVVVANGIPSKAVSVTVN